MTYKGYTARVEYDDEDRVFTGVVVDLNDVIHFEGTTVEELEEAFRESVDAYLAFCKEHGRVPEQPYSEQLHLRVPAELHRRVRKAAENHGKSVNDLIVEALAEKVGVEPVAKVA